MQAPRYFPLQDSLSTRPDSRVLAANLLLTPWHRPCCPKCHQPHTPCRRQPQLPAAYHLLALCSWYFVLAAIYERRCGSSISWAISACRLVYLSGVILKRDQETWLPTCDSTWFWSICYSAKPSHPVHSFGAWHLYCGLAFEVLGRGGRSASTWSSSFEARRIILPRSSILSGDQGLLCKKPEDNIRSWARKAWNQC